MAYVYRHIRLDKNEPFYIGIGADYRYRRAHDKHKGRRSEAWFRIVQKTDYEVEILFDNIPIEVAKEKEIEFIYIHGRRDLGTGTLVNMTDGGDGLNNRVFTPEYRKKLSEAAKRREPQPQLQKIIQWRMDNRFPSDETKQKLSQAHFGKKRSAEHIENARKAKIGSNNPMFGKRGVSSANFKGFILAYKGDEFVGKYEGVHKCANELNLTATKISACLNGRRNMTGGFTFKRQIL
jgi:hypothetical protein